MNLKNDATLILKFLNKIILAMFYKVMALYINVLSVIHFIEWNNTIATRKSLESLT